MGWDRGLKKIGRVYHAKIRVHGVLYQRSTGHETRDGAVGWLRRFRKTLLDAEEGVGPAPTVDTLVELWEEDAKLVRRDSHVKRVMGDMRSYILPNWGERRADTITQAEIGALRREYLAATGPKGRHTLAGANALMRNVRLVWSWGVSEKLLAKVPFVVKVEKIQKKPKATLPVDTLVPFMREISKCRNPHVRICVAAMAYLGLREGEAVRMEWAGFSGPDLAWYCPPETKDKGDRTLPVPPFLAEWIKALPEPKHVRWVLPAGDEPHYGQYTAKAIRRAGEAVGIPRLTPHRLRGTAATLLARLGVDPWTIKDFMGHEKIETTLEYVEVGRKEFLRAQEKLLAASGGEIVGTIQPYTPKSKRGRGSTSKAVRSHNP